MIGNIQWVQSVIDTYIGQVTNISKPLVLGSVRIRNFWPDLDPDPK